MKSFLIVLFLIQVSLLISIVVDYDDLSAIKQAMVIPDMAGKVNCTQEFLAAEITPSMERVLPELADGWPQSFPSSNCYKGAIYANMDEDPELEILFGVGTKIAALNIDGSSVPGWPVQLGYYIWSSPACGDIDGDGFLEIVACSRNNTSGNEGELYAYELNGSAVNGFPVTMAGGGTMNASLADIDNDEDLEIFVNVRNHPDGWTYVFDGDGTVFEGWPQQLNTFPGSGISVADITGDDIPEVIGLSYESLYAFDTAGNILDGFPVSEDGYNYSYSQPIIADIDDDGMREIIYGGCADGGAVFAVNSDGSYVDGWPQTVEYWIFANPALADLDDDGDLEIVIGDQVSSSNPVDHIYAWHTDGSAVTGFPAGPTNAIYAQAGIADLDGDDAPEIMIDDNVFGNGYECYNNDGTHCDDWPLPTGTGWDAITMQMTPVFGDIDLDGNLEIMGAATGFTSWLVECCLWDTDSPWNEDLAYMHLDGCNIQHTGKYPQELAPPPPPAPEECNAIVLNYNDVRVQWVMEESGQIGFNLYLNGEIHVSDITPELREIDLYGFNDGTYEIYVTAIYEDQESDPSPSAEVTVNLDPPVNLYIDVMCNTAMLYWSVPGSRDLTGYNIYRDEELISTVADTTYEDTELPDDVYQYYVTAVYSDSIESAESNVVTIEVVDVNENEVVASVMNISNYPNPFNPETEIFFELADTEFLSMNIYNSKGQLVRKLAENSYTAGKHSIIWNGKSDNSSTVPSGIYLVKIKSGNEDFTHKLMLLK